MLFTVLIYYRSLFVSYDKRYYVGAKTVKGASEKNSLRTDEFFFTFRSDLSLFKNYLLKPSTTKAYGKKGNFFTIFPAKKNLIGFDKIVVSVTIKNYCKGKFTIAFS